MSTVTRTTHPLAFLLLASFAAFATACDDGVTPTAQPSTVQVRAFIDLDGSGSFTTGDEPIADAQVTLTPGTGGTPLQATTDAEGLATFADVPAGTYQASIDAAATPEDAVLVSAATPTVVAPFEGGTITAQFRFVYEFQTIAAIKALEAGSEVFVRGVVTAEAGAYRAANDNVYIQDATSGIQVFGVDPDLMLPRGADVRVRGVMGAFQGEVQITSPEVVVIGTAAVPAPREVTGPQIAERTFEGELAVVRVARVLTVAGGTAAGYNVTMSHDEQTFIVRVEAPLGATVVRADWEVGAGYDIVGALGSFAGAAQLKPRTGDDIVRVADPVDPPDPDVVTIAEARALEDGTLVQIDAVVTVGFEMHRREGDNIYMQDATGGLQVFGSALIPLELEIGDSIRVTGLMATFSQERQIGSPTVEVLGTGTVPDPIDLSADAFNALTHEGELVRIVDVEVVSVPSSTDAQGRYNIVVEDAEGEMQIRIEGGIAEDFPLTFWEVGSRYTVTGALGRFNLIAQLKPRMLADVEEL